jgi:HAD superfamily phosphatase (TIGR01668 family)
VSLFAPNHTFLCYRDVSAEFLREQGIDALLLDIDNTLAPYEVAEPDRKMAGWFHAMKTAGIKMAFVSNNKGDRVKIFNRTLGLPLFAGAKKPFTKGVRQALAALEITPQEAAGLGDQIFTDCLACHRAGMRFYLVPPIKDKKTPFFRCKRFLEKPFVGKFKYYRTYLSQTQSV